MGLRETLLSASTYLKHKGHDIFDYPLMLNQRNGNESIVQDIIENIIEKKIDVVLWWYYNISTVDMCSIKNTLERSNVPIKFILFNWDEPYNWCSHDNLGKANLIDIAFITCKSSVKKWVDAGAGKAICLYAAYDPLIHTPFTSKSHMCDISICCTNLYTSKKLYPGQYMNRHKLINLIYDNQSKYGYTFDIYGPESLKHLYPRSYKPFVRYGDLSLVFAKSKMNLCTHVTNNCQGYLNERVGLVMASGGLLLVDDVGNESGIIKDGANCFIFDREDPIKSITDILKLYDTDEGKIDDMKQQAIKDARVLHYGNWADTIDKGIRMFT